MTEITTRQKSIKKIELLRSSIPYQGGDWDDAIAAFSGKVPPHDTLPGITVEEYRTLIHGDSCPRACSTLLAELSEEIEGVVFEGDDQRAQIMRTIKELRSTLASLEALYKSM